MVVVGTRPNFIKVTRFKAVAAMTGAWQVDIVHTGQHADDRMSRVFFDQFGLEPDHWLDVQGGTPSSRIARIMSALEPVAQTLRPDLVMVVGDVDSTLAAALTANKMGLPIAHLESGLRSRDMGMPEEVNRILTDRITRHFFVTEPSGLENLRNEGADMRDVHHVGNTMIDTLLAFDDAIHASPVLDELRLDPEGHVLMTIHRPANVDEPVSLGRVVDLIMRVARDHHVVFPVHPRTTMNLQRFGLMDRLKDAGRVHLAEPMDYFGFQKLVATCAFVITDSGGIQEETTFRRKPCLTLRPSTERPVTITEGTNELITFDPDALDEAMQRITAGRWKTGSVPKHWDGHATERVFDVLNRIP